MLIGIWVLAIGVIGAFWTRQDTPEADGGTLASETEPAYVRGPIQPIPQRIDVDPEKVSLGRRLFHDARLSGDGTISCASCHALDKGGADGRRFSVGHRGAKGEINSPTVLNAVFNFRQYWDGRAADLGEQIDGPLTNPKEMASSWEKAIRLCETDPTYRRAFVSIYGKVDRAGITDAIVEFEKSLITPDSDFDRFLRGDKNAISEDARRGFDRFVERGCATCHQGINVGGNMFQTFGKMKDYFGRKERLTRADMGRYNVTGRESDKHRFKVPTLRNIALTAPYLHDGSARTLEDAIQIMAEYELGARLTDEDTRLIVAFLESLTGRLPK